MEVLIREEGEAAARRVESAWNAHPVGRQLLATAGDDLGRASRDYPLAAARSIRDWQGDVLDLVVREGGAKKSAARFWALGVNGVGVALMVLVFSQTGGLVGAEIGVAGGTAVLAQRVLEAIFGEDAVRRLARQAKRDLDSRVEALMADELARYTAALDAVDVRPELAGEIVAAVADLEAVRASDEHLRFAGSHQHELTGQAGPAALEAGPAPEAEAVEGEIIETGREPG
jgi:hypothetical protein